MISKAKLQRTQAQKYYTGEEQKHSDYYAQGSNTKDRYGGRLQEHYRLPDNITEDSFNQNLGKSENAAYDITFSPPKSVSLAAECADLTTRERIQRAIHNAVSETIRDIEDSVCARVTKNHKTEQIKTGAMVYARFIHHTSRGSDPQYHEHVVIMNKTIYNGKEYAIDNRLIYQNSGYYIQKFDNRLAANLLAEGFELREHRNRKSSFELKDISDEAILEMSKRRAAIEKWVEDHETTTHEAGSIAAIKTRQSKKHHDLDLLREGWGVELEGLGQKPIPNRTQPRIATEQQIKEVYDRTMNLMSRKTFAFTENEFCKVFMEDCVRQGVTDEQFKELFRADIGKDIYSLGERKGGMPGVKYYCTEQSRRMERWIFDGVEKGKDTMKAISPQVTRDFLDAFATTEGNRLNDEQRRSVEAIMTTHDKYFAVQGWAGTGKTFMLNAAREGLEMNGYKVIGACNTGKAAEELIKGANINDCGTIHRFLNSLEKEAGNAKHGEDYLSKAAWNLDGLRPGPQKEVWIIDEASMVDNVAMWHVMKAAELKEAKVVLTGDRKQHAPVGVGNAFANMVGYHKINFETMEKIVRQKDTNLRESVIEAIQGDMRLTFEKLKDNTQVIVDRKERLSALVKDYMGYTPEQRDKTVILTGDNKTRQEINQRVHREKIKAGELTKDGIKCEVVDTHGNTRKRDFIAGDKIIFLRNEKRLGVNNGQTGFVDYIDGQNMVIVSDKDPIKERTVTRINLGEYNYIDYGYALTSHKAQGITEDRALIHLDSAKSKLNTRNAYYVDVSRAREEVKIYMDDWDKVLKQVSVYATKLTSDDFQQSSEPGQVKEVNITKEVLINEPRLSKDQIQSGHHGFGGRAKRATERADRAKADIGQAGTETRIDRGAVTIVHQNEGNRVPEQPGHGRVNEILRKVRGVRDRTEHIKEGMATRNDPMGSAIQPKIKGVINQQPDFNSGNINGGIQDPRSGTRRDGGRER